MESQGYCPKCKSKSFVKNGKVKEVQRYLCKDCGYKFTVFKNGKCIDASFVRQTIYLYLEGLSFREIGKILGISHTTVRNWVGLYGRNLATIRIQPESSNVLTVDVFKSQKGGVETTYYGGFFIAGFGNKCIISTISF